MRQKHDKAHRNANNVYLHHFSPQYSQIFKCKVSIYFFLALVIRLVYFTASLTDSPGLQRGQKQLKQYFYVIEELT